MSRIGHSLRYRLREAPATVIITALCVGVWLLQTLIQPFTAQLWFVGLYLLPLPPLSELPGISFEPWRLITAMFAHSTQSPLHLFFNMLCLWFLGFSLERTFGWKNLLAVYFLSGIGGSLLAFYLAPINQPLVGASGGIFGLFAAVLVLHRHLGVPPRSVWPIIILNVGISFIFPGISWQAHLGGLLVGGIVGQVIKMSLASRAPVPAAVSGYTAVFGLMVALILLRPFLVPIPLA